jgi:hypothetical protein
VTKERAIQACQRRRRFVSQTTTTGIIFRFYAAGTLEEILEFQSKFVVL